MVHEDRATVGRGVHHVLHVRMRHGHVAVRVLVRHLHVRGLVWHEATHAAAAADLLLVRLGFECRLWIWVLREVIALALLRRLVELNRNAFMQRHAIVHEGFVKVLSFGL